MPWTGVLSSRVTSGITVKGVFRFTRNERITHPHDFRRVLKTGRRLSSRSFLLFLQENRGPLHRLGIVVKKEIGSAAFRNQTKRYVREFFRLHKHQIQGSYDMVLLVKKGFSARRYSEVEAELKGLLL